MKSVFKGLMVLGLMAVLSGCESYRLGGTDEDRIVDFSPQEVGLMPMGVHPVMSPLQTMSDPDLMNVYRGISSQQGGYIGAPSGGGIVAPQDSRVTLFPVDGEMPWSGGQTYLPAGTSEPYGAMPKAGAGSHIYFKHGSSSLNAQDRSVLQQVAQEAKFAPVERIRIEGHASMRSEASDPVRGRILNLKESMNRSYAVSRDLIRQGVPPEKIKTVSWGDSNLQSGTSESEARRVDIFAGGR